MCAGLLESRCAESRVKRRSLYYLLSASRLGTPASPAGHFLREQKRADGSHIGCKLASRNQRRIADPPEGEAAAGIRVLFVARNDMCV